MARYDTEFALGFLDGDGKEVPFSPDLLPWGDTDLQGEKKGVKVTAFLEKHQLLRKGTTLSPPDIVHLNSIARFLHFLWGVCVPIQCIQTNYQPSCHRTALDCVPKHDRRQRIPPVHAIASALQSRQYSRGPLSFIKEGLLENLLFHDKHATESMHNVTEEYWNTIHSLFIGVMEKDLFVHQLMKSVFDVDPLPASDETAQLPHPFIDMVDSVATFYEKCHCDALASEFYWYADIFCWDPAWFALLHPYGLLCRGVCVVGGHPYGLLCRGVFVVGGHPYGLLVPP